MSSSEHGILVNIRDQIESLSEFSHELAQCAAPDFVWQSEIAEGDLVLPLQHLRFPCEAMYSSRHRLDTFFDLLSFLVSQYIYSFDDERPLMGLYVSSMSLVGVVRHQTPDSAEFSIAGRCLVLILATESIKHISPNTVALFIIDLHEHAARCPENYWDFPWIKVSLLATAIALSSRLSVNADTSSKLSEFLQKPEWKKSIDEKYGDPNSSQELRALATLLQRCGLLFN